MTQREISKQIGISTGVLCRIMKKYGLTKNKEGNTGKRYTKEEKKQIKKMLDDGYTFKEISNIIKRPYDSIRK